MTRRLTRTLIQALTLAIVVLLLLFLADARHPLLPSSIHHLSPAHHPGSVLTDVTLHTCTPPFSSCRLDPSRWSRIDKDLYLGTSWLRAAYLHICRKREEDLLPGQDRVVIDVRISARDPSLVESEQLGAEWEARGGNLWILRSEDPQASDSPQALTGLDVLFGPAAVEPRPGWSLLSSPLSLPGIDPDLSPRLTFHTGPPQSPPTNFQPPRIRKDGKFKILQLSDLHLSTGAGACRDAIDANGFPREPCIADTLTLAFVERVLDDEIPDLVVLSGDQIEGPTAPDTQTALLKLLSPLITRKIPYATIFGNHDDEGVPSSPKKKECSGRLSREEQMHLLATLPFNLASAGPETVSGVGNYHLEIRAASAAGHSALTLYFLDTHSLSPDERAHPGYAWLTPDQIAWFRALASGLRKEHAKYSHVHLDLAFLHIPLPEYAETRNIVVGGKWREGVTAPGVNTGFYTALREEGVVAVGVGHDHVNDFCGLRPAEDVGKEKLGPWLCYAGGAGFGGYGGYGGFQRRGRVWEVDTNAGRVTTWKRVECCGEEVERRVDEVVLVEGGVVVGPSESSSG